MRVVLQRVCEASVSVDGEAIASIGRGLVALIGVARGDDLASASEMGRKIAHLRLFPDGDHAFHRSLVETRGSLLCVSQFTLLGDARRGNRPSWTAAAGRFEAEPLVSAVADAAAEAGARVARGRFGAEMVVHLANDGPVTLVLECSSAAPPARAGS